MVRVVAPDQALTLDELLKQANTDGIGWEIVKADNQAMPKIVGIGSLSHANAAEITFLSNPKFFPDVIKSQAGAIILPQQAIQALPQTAFPFIIVQCENPYLLYARLAQWFDAQRLANKAKGIHPSAIIDPSATIEEGVTIGPLCVIEAHAHIGVGSVLGPSCIVGEKVHIGSDCLLHARVTLYHDVQIGNRAIIHSGAVIGADGFGFAPDTLTKGAWSKIAQLGSVQIGDDVEIGACTTIDRGAIENTRIGNGVKLDNQIMIAHNVHIDDHTAMAACVGVAGSTRIGKRCIIGGAALFSGHIKVCDDVVISGGTSVIASIDKPAHYTGLYPMAEHKEWQKNAAVVQQLSALRKRLRLLEKNKT